MFQVSRSLLLSLFVVVAGCAPTPPVRATWEYVELTKNESGQVQEIGDRHTLRSGGDEMYKVNGRALEVVTVNSSKAKFRLRGGESAVNEEAELQPGNSHDLWSGTVGVRLRVEKIGPISD